MRERKTYDIWGLYVNYGYGYEEEIIEDTYIGYKENKKAYKENCNEPQKWIKKRVKKEGVKCIN